MTGDDQRAGWVGGWARKYYRQVIVVRALLAPWIVFVTVFLCVKGYWVGTAAIAAAPPSLTGGTARR